MSSSADESSVRLTIAEEPVSKGANVTSAEPEVDLQHRDPYDLHPNFKIRFHDVFGEPDDSVFSFDFVWRWAFKLFTTVKLWTYRILSLVCGLPAAIYWGIHFAVLSFCAIWCCEPYMKAWAIELSCFKRIYETTLYTFVRPCFEVCGYLFYNIRIRKE